jgi:hypothetical protein
MPQIGNLGVRLQWQFYVLDDAGNTHALPSEPIQIQEPTEEAFLAAWRRFESEREGHRTRLAEQMEAARASENGRAGKRRGHAEKPALAGVEE